MLCSHGIQITHDERKVKARNLMCETLYLVGTTYLFNVESTCSEYDSNQGLQNGLNTYLTGNYLKYKLTFIKSR